MLAMSQIHICKVSTKRITRTSSLSRYLRCGQEGFHGRGGAFSSQEKNTEKVNFVCICSVPQSWNLGFIKCTLWRRRPNLRATVSFALYFCLPLNRLAVSPQKNSINYLQIYYCSIIFKIRYFRFEMYSAQEFSQQRARSSTLHFMQN